MFISCEDTKKLIKEKNAQFIDVRTPAEFLSSQLPSAVNIPLQELESSVATLDKDLPVVVFCRSGNRSEVAMQFLQSLGYTEVYNMGSYMYWK
jgi:rhodanese-related sulfurtransferase